MNNIFFSKDVLRQDFTVRTVLYHVHIIARRVTVTSLRGLVLVVKLDIKVLLVTKVITYQKIHR